jgi:hypothetical protein
MPSSHTPQRPSPSRPPTTTPPPAKRPCVTHLSDLSYKDPHFGFTPGSQTAAPGCWTSPGRSIILSPSNTDATFSPTSPSSSASSLSFTSSHSALSLSQCTYCRLILGRSLDSEQDSEQFGTSHAHNKHSSLTSQDDVRHISLLYCTCYRVIELGTMGSTANDASAAKRFRLSLLPPPSPSPPPPPPPRPRLPCPPLLPLLLLFFPLLTPLSRILNSHFLDIILAIIGTLNPFTTVFLRNSTGNTLPSATFSLSMILVVSLIHTPTWANLGGSPKTLSSQSFVCSTHMAPTHPVASVFGLPKRSSLSLPTTHGRSLK